MELLYAIAEITDGCFYVFYDKNQLVQQRQTLDWVNRIECRLVLSCNCRNTRNIAVTSYKPLGIDKIKMRVDIPGQKPTMHLTQNIDDARQTIGNIIRNYTRQGIQKKTDCHPDCKDRRGFFVVWCFFCCRIYTCAKP